MSERLKARLTILGLITSICLGLGGPFATYQLLQFRIDAAEVRDVKMEKRMDNSDSQNFALRQELSLIRETLGRIDERLKLIQEQENRRYTR